MNYCHEKIDKNRGFRIHMNLHKKCFSVSQYIVSKKGWRVTNHVKSLEAINVVFKISEKGRQRAINNKSRNVHAYAYADKVGLKPLKYFNLKNSCNYNPFKKSFFYNLENGEKVSNLEYAYFNECKINY